MSVTEVIQTFEEMQKNWFAGGFIVIYYALIYWPRLKEGFGIGKKSHVNLNRVEQRYKILKLKIEIENMKLASSIPDEQLQALEADVLQESKSVDTHKQKKKKFSTAQKFVGIPLIIFIILLAISEIIQGEGGQVLIDTLLGFIIFIILIIAAFWGIPKLIKSPPGAVRTTGFIVFWWFAFYVGLYLIGSLLDSAILSVIMSKEVTIFSNDDIGGLYFIGSLIVAVVLGIMGKLPKMKDHEVDSTKEHEKKQMTEL